MCVGAISWCLCVRQRCVCADTSGATWRGVNGCESESVCGCLGWPALCVWTLQVSECVPGLEVAGRRRPLLGCCECENEYLGALEGERCVCMCACARAQGWWGASRVCFCVCVCGPVTAGSRPGHINFTLLQAGPAAPQRPCRAMGSRWARMEAIWGWGRGRIPPSQRCQEAPCLPAPHQGGAGTDTVTNVPQPAWSQPGAGREEAPPRGRVGL